MVACEVVWLQKLLYDLDVQVDGPVVIYCNNMSSIQLARNPVFHARTKHIEVLLLLLVATNMRASLMITPRRYGCIF